MYRYRPGNVQSLATLVGADAVQDAKNAYFGSALWRIIQYLAGGESSFPSWQDVFDKKKHTQKKETADEIKSKIIREMRR